MEVATTVGERKSGAVPWELNAALEDLSKLMGDCFRGFVAEYKMFSGKKEPRKKSKAEAEVFLSSNRELKLNFLFDYPWAAALNAYFRFFIAREAGTEYMKKLQRRAGPIAWTFKGARSNDSGVWLEFNLSREHMKQMGICSCISCLHEEECAWDDPRCALELSAED